MIFGAVLVLAAGAGVAVATLGGSPAATGTTPAGPSAEPTPALNSATAPANAVATASVPATEAVDWIGANVGSGHVVACDATICALLRGRGFPSSSLITVQSRLADVEQGDLVATTDVMRRQLGSSLADVTAGESLAVFSDGSSTIQIKSVALAGPSDYAGRLAADRAARKTAGVALLHNPRITLSAAARAPLSAGLVDGRVCTLLSVLGGSHTITVTAFTGPGPGAGPDIPFAGFVISTIDGVNAAEDSPQTAALSGILNAQRPPYSPLSTTRVSSGADQGLVILFSQPGPIGLLSPTKP